MKSTLLTALLIVAGGAAAGAVANAVKYKEPWIKPEKRVTVEEIVVDKPAAGDSVAPDAAGETGGASGGGEKPASTVASNPCAPDPERPGVVGLECVLHFLENGGAYFIDAREQHDYDSGRLKGAIHVPSSAIVPSIEANLLAAGIPSFERVIVYCGGGSCEASHNVADALRDRYFFEKVYIYEKGWEEVEASGRFGAFIQTGGGN